MNYANLKKLGVVFLKGLLKGLLLAAAVSMPADTKGCIITGMAGLALGLVDTSLHLLENRKKAA